MALLPLQDTTPQLLGPRAYAQRRQQTKGSIDPTGWFKRFLSQYKVAGREGKATFSNPRSGGEYMGAAKKLDRSAAELQALTKTYENNFANPAADPLGIGGSWFLQTALQRGTERLVPQLEQGSRTLQLGAQVFGQAPGEFTNQVADWQRAIAQQQSLGGTYYSQAGAAQAAAGNAALVNTARAELAGPLDASVGLQGRAEQLRQSITGLRDVMEDWRNPMREQQRYLRGDAKGQSTATRNPLGGGAGQAFLRGPQARLLTGGQPQRGMGMITRRM